MGWLLIAILIGAATALAVIAGFGGVVLLSVNHRRQRLTEKDHELAKGQAKREQTNLFNERFAAAAEQLAHERPQVRLAGVHALAGLADDLGSTSPV